MTHDKYSGNHAWVSGFSSAKSFSEFICLFFHSFIPSLIQLNSQPDNVLVADSWTTKGGFM